jgi:CarD family transcriptional regulator
MFKQYDKAVYNSYGIVTVKRIETKTVASKSKKFYVLSVDNNQMTILCPVDDSSAMRPIANELEVKQVLAYIANTQVKIDALTWNRRYREYMELLKTGEFIKIAEVYKKLVTYKGSNELSFGERKMLDMAKGLLTSEISLVLGLDENDTDALLELARSGDTQF